MITSISRAFSEAFRNLRSNFFQTFLSVLGVIIGVGALVAMLALIDGLDRWAQERIADKSSLEVITVTSQTGTRIDGVYTPRDTVAEIDASTMRSLLDSLPYEAKAQLMYQGSSIGRRMDSTKLGIRYQAFTMPFLEPIPDSLVLHGRMITEAESQGGAKVAAVNKAFARKMVGETDSLDVALGSQFMLFGDTLTIVGVMKNGDQQGLTAGLPLNTLTKFPGKPRVTPNLMIALDNVHNVLSAQEYVDGWMERQFPDIPEATQSFTQTGYLEELGKGMLVFRLVMGFLVGIAVVVGGVGVMNVLLMAISERTPEIGIRKAVGANRKKIIVQFLSESIAISIIGCFFGVILGMLVASIAAPILTYLIPETEFSAVFTLNTLMVVVIVAILVGVIFGTYPARKAAGLDPVEAIRR
jgi:putative ABC transport system permease protein